MKKVLVLCTGNSCRSIIAEALINEYLEGVEAKSAGVKACGEVNKNAKKVLQNQGIWKETYHSKNIKDLEKEDFDLVVTVCDKAKENCPIFPKHTKTLHINYEDPNGKEIETFNLLYKKMKNELLKSIQESF